MNQGFILLHRQLIDWQWYTHLPCKVLFIHCLLKANHAPTKWRGQEVQRGEFITSIQHLAIDSGLTIKQVRNALDILIKSGELGKVSTSVNTLISITNYDKYQIEGKPNGKPRANQGQTKGKPRANEGQQTINDNNDNQFKNEDELEAPKAFDFKKAWINIGVEKKTVDDWVKARKKGTNTETAFRLIKAEIEKSKLSAQQCIEMAVLRGWQGFKADWVKDSKPQQVVVSPVKVASHVHVDQNKDYSEGWFKK